MLHKNIVHWCVLNFKRFFEHATYIYFFIIMIWSIKHFFQSMMLLEKRFPLRSCKSNIFIAIDLSHFCLKRIKHYFKSQYDARYSIKVEKYIIRLKLLLREIPLWSLWFWWTHLVLFEINVDWILCKQVRSYYCVYNFFYYQLFDNIEFVHFILNWNIFLIEAKIHW